MKLKHIDPIEKCVRQDAFFSPFVGRIWCSPEGPDSTTYGRRLNDMVTAPVFASLELQLSMCRSFPETLFRSVQSCTPVCSQKRNLAATCIIRAGIALTT